ncbi:MAG: hypothetical protein JRJ29_19115, partial [Deltaproteobacteria bacterium]|nr:hypothetical protein [Deltaproteobacteria bacterium]
MGRVHVPWLREIEPYAPAMIHPETDGRLGIGEQDWVWIETRHGKARFKA